LGVAPTKPKRDVVLIWLASGTKAKLADFAGGAAFDDLESAIMRAAQATPKGMSPWICCEKKFVMGPDDIAMAFGQMREGG
jgi:hypothetical protein